MLERKKRCHGLVLAVLLAAGCNQADGPSGPASPTPAQTSETAAQLRLNAEPAGAKGVIEARKEAKDGETVVVVGRIAGGEEPLVKGRAAFTVVDLSLESCEDEKPWVFCCTPKEELAQAMVYVKFVDEQGKTLAQDARGLLGLKEMDTVVVRGEARRDDAGNLTSILAEGLYVRK